MGGVVEGLFGSGQTQTDWSQVEKLMELQAKLNRNTQEGFFTTNTWNENPDGTWTQSQSINPALQGGLDRLLARAGGHSDDFQPYQRPAQFDKLLQAKMANQFQGHGLQGLNGQGQIPMTQQGFGKPLNHQPGRDPVGQQQPTDYSAMLPPAPPQQQQPPQLPGGYNLPQGAR